MKSTLEGARSNVDAYHSRIYTQATAIVQNVGIDEAAPRLASRKQHRNNVLPKTAQITIALILQCLCLII